MYHHGKPLPAKQDKDSEMTANFGPIAYRAEWLLDVALLQEKGIMITDDQPVQMRRTIRHCLKLSENSEIQFILIIRN